MPLKAKIFSIFVFLLLWGKAIGQDLFIVSSTNAIYSANPTSFVSFVQQLNISAVSFTDIAIADSGKFFGVTQNSDIYELDTSTGNTTLLLSNSGFGTIVSLVADDSNKLYFIDNSSNHLFIYNTLTTQLDSIYNNEFETPGDATFYKGKFIFPTRTDKIGSYDFQTNTLNFILCPVNTNLWGISTVQVNCDSAVIYATNTIGNMFVVNLDSNTLDRTPFNLRVPFLTIYGMASTTERLAFNCGNDKLNSVSCPPAGGGSGGSGGADPFSGSVGIKDVNESTNNFSISVYPNPIEKNQKLFFNSDKKIDHVTARSITGQEILVNFSQKSISFPSNVSSGLYFISFQSDETILTKKIIIR